MFLCSVRQLQRRSVQQLVKRNSVYMLNSHNAIPKAAMVQPIKFGQNSTLFNSSIQRCFAADASSTPSTKGPKESRMQTLKRNFKNYGYIFVLYWAAGYVLTFIPVYLSFEHFGVNGIELFDMLQDKLGIENKYDISWIEPKYVNLFIAFEITEIGEIFRIPFILATTPALAKFIRSFRK